MAKRLSDTDKWKDSWFIDLSLQGKILFLFLCDNCNIAGFYERSDKMMIFYLGMTKEDLDKATQEIEKSVVCRNGVYFVKNFIYHQKNTPLNPINNCHKAIITQLLRRQEVFKDLYNGLLRGLKGAGKPLPSPYGKGKGKGKGKGRAGVLGEEKRFDPKVQELIHETAKKMKAPAAQRN